MNVAELVRRAAAAHPERVAIIEGGREITYGELWENIEALASEFAGIGIREGSKVALLLPNGTEFIGVLFALLALKAVAVPIKPQTERYQLRSMLERSRAETYILSPNLLNDFFLREGFDLIHASRVILAPAKAGDARIMDPDNRLDEDCLFRLTDLLERGRAAPTLTYPLRASRNQLATINYTYRGYGYPLGAMLTHHHYIHGAIRYIKLEEIDESMRILLSLPVAHIFPLIGGVFVPLLAKATIVIPSSLSPRRVFDAIQEARVNVLACVPTLYEFLVKHFRPGKWDLSSVRFGICGGEPLLPGLHERVRASLGFELVEGYGLTETMPVTCNPRWGNRPGTLGIPGRDVVLRIVDSRGDDCRPGEIGEIVVRCGSIMLGYHEAPDETAEAVRNGWFYTGDYGSIDGEGYVHFKGLRKAIAKVNGVTVDLASRTHPRECRT
jgi:long-chain acyl-CoA synthetase